MAHEIEITAERIARLHSLGLTKRTPDQLDEILSTLAALDAAQAEYEAASNEAGRIYTPANDADRWIGWQCYLPEPLATLYTVANDTDRLCWDRGSSLAEHYPISLWQKSAAAFRAQAKRIRKAIKATAVQAVV